MNKTVQAISFQDFLTTQSVNVDLSGFLINLIITALLSSILAFTFVRFSQTVNNRKLFARNLPLIAVTTMVIISIVKSSLALSLGLVGALSIVRFRTAIKEPEELGFLFFSIAIGLGLGANQRALSLIGFAAVIVLIIAIYFVTTKKTNDEANLFMTFFHPDNGEVLVNEVVEKLKPSCERLQLKRFDVTDNGFEASFLVSFKSYDEFKVISKSLLTEYENLKFSVIDNEGVFS